MEAQDTTRAKNRMTNKFLIISLAVLLAIALGFIVWQNFIHKEPTVVMIDSSMTNQKPMPSDTPAQAEALPDTLDYGNGIAISMQSDLAKLTNAPASFTSYINGLLESATTASTDDGCTFEIVVKKIYKQQYAIGQTHSTGPGCGSGFATLWGDKNGSWKKLAGSQENAFGCEDLTKYQVPSTIAGPTCIESATPEGRPYSQE